MSSPVEFRIRAFRPDDDGEKQFVLKSWVGAARQCDMKTRRIDSHLFNAWMSPTAVSALGRSQILIAAPSDDDATIYGFAVFEPGLIHMVYVRPQLRKLGIARALLATVPYRETAFSTWTSECSWVCDKHPKLKYMPLWLGESVHGRQAAG